MIDGELGISRWEDLTKHLGLADRMNYSCFPQNGSLAAGQSEELVGAERGACTPERAAQFRAAFRRLTIVIIYESMYREEEFRYVFRGESLPPENA